MNAILTVYGQDKVGIIAQTSTYLAEQKINILDMSQTIMGNNFVMMMSVQLPKGADFMVINHGLAQIAKNLSVEINLRNNELYDAMHQI